MQYLSLLCLVTTDQLQYGAFIPGVISAPLLLIFKILYRKFWECCALCITKYLWYHILENYCSNTLFVSWSMLCTVHILHVYTACIWDAIFDTNVYNAFIMKPRDFRNPSAASCCNHWFKFCQLGSCFSKLCNSKKHVIHTRCEIWWHFSFQ